jgi:hypothetical protein
MNVNNSENDAPESPNAPASRDEFSSVDQRVGQVSEVAMAQGNSLTFSGEMTAGVLDMPHTDSDVVQSTMATKRRTKKPRRSWKKPKVSRYCNA